MVSDTRQMDVYKIEKRNTPLSFGVYKEFLTFYYKTPIELQEGSLVTVHCTIPLTYLEESKEYELSSSLPIHSVNASNNSITILINKYYTLNNISSIKTDDGVYLLSSNKHYFGEDSTDITIYVNDEDETGNITIKPQKCSFVNENTLKWEGEVYEKEGHIVTYMRLNPIGDERYTNTVFYYEYKTQIPVALSGMSDVRLMQEDALNVDYVNRERAKLINPIVEMEKDIYHPVAKNGNSIEDVQRIVINPHFRQHRGEDWLAAPDSLWNGVTTEDTSFEDSFFSYKTKENQADLLIYLNFTDSDVKYQKSKIKKSFLRLMYFDSPDPTNQNMIGYSTIFMDAGRFFTKTIKNMESMPYQYTNVDGELMQDLVGIKVNREPYGDLTKNESEIEQYRLSSQFTVEDRYNSEGSSEGFYVYLWKDIDNYAPSDLYLKIEFNHAGYGRTIPLMMPYWLENEKDPNSDSEHGKKSIKTFNEILEDWRYGGYSLRKYNEYSYIHLKYQYDKKQKRHIYYLDPNVYGNINLSENGDLILNLYEAKISMGQVADNDVVYVTGYGDITNVKLNYTDIPSAGGLIYPSLDYKQEVKYSNGQTSEITSGAITTYTPLKINDNPFVSSLPSSGSDGALCIIEKKGKTTNTYTQYEYSNKAWRQINTYTFHTSKGWIQAGKNNQSKDIDIFTVSVSLKLNGKSETATSNDITQLAGSSTELGETFTMQITNVPSEIGVNGQTITPTVTIYRSVTLSNGSTMTETYTGGKFTYTWVLDNTVKGANLTYTIPENTQFSPRSGSFTAVWEEGDNSLEETVNFTQEAAIPDTDYTFESAMPKTNVFGSEGGTWTFYFNSYKDVNAQGYTITKNNNLKWFDVKNGKSGSGYNSSVVITVNKSETGNEDATIVLKQNESNKEIILTISQESGTVIYDFLFDDYDGTDVTYPHQQPVTEKSFKFDITSKNNRGEGVTFTASSDESWCTTEIKDNGKGSYTVTATYKDNDQKKERDCTITLTQEGSGNVLTMSFTQAGLQYDFWYDDYQDQDTIDVEFMSQPETKSFFMTSITNTGAQIGVLISGTTDWCSAETQIDNNTGRLILYVTVTENTGDDRETQLVFTQETSNKKLYMNVSQKLVTYTFEFLEAPDKNEMSVTLDTLANTYQYNIISLRHTVVETSVNFTITQNEGDEWCQVEHEVDEDDGIFLTTVSVSDNVTGSVRTSEIIFTQEDSGKTLKLIVNQAPKDYVFEFQDYPNTNTITLDTFDTSQSTARVTINSLSPANELIMPEHKSSHNWISYAVIEGTNGRFNVNINIPSNDTKESRGATITLIQPGSGRVLTININQEGEAQYEFYWVMGPNQVTSVNTIAGSEITPDKTFYRSLQLVSTKNGKPFEDSVIEGPYYGSITKSIFNVSYPVADTENTTVEVGMTIQVLNDTKSGTWEIRQKESGLILRFQYIVTAGANYQFQFSDTIGNVLQSIIKYKEARYLNIDVSDSYQNITIPIYSTKDMNVWPTDTNKLLQTIPATAFVDQSYAGSYVFNKTIKVDTNYGEARSIDVHFIQRVYIDNINYEGSSIDLLLRIDQGASTNANTFMIPNATSTYSLRAMYPIVYAPAKGGMVSTEVVSYVNRKMTGFQIPSASGFINNIIKTNKEYVHEIYFDIEPNPSTEERNQLVKFIQKDTNDEIIVEIIQEGKVETIDYAVLKFSWDNTNGAKLDIASEISNSNIIIDGNPIDNTPVGYGFGPAYANERDINTILPDYIEFGGVNTANNNQMEVLIHVKEIMDKNTDLSSLIVNTYGNWIDSNNSVITIETNGYYGGSMQLVNNSFENVDGKLISNNTTQAYVYAQGSCNDPQINEDFRNNYTHFIETVYDIENNEINTIPTNYNEGNICS